VTDALAQEETKITAHLIFGVNAPPESPDVGLSLTLAPPSPYARRVPLYMHPSTAAVDPLPRTWNFHSKIKYTQEPEILARNQLNSPTRTHSGTVGGGGLEWGTWFGFIGDNAKITNPSLAFLADLFLHSLTLLPSSEREGLATRSGANGFLFFSPAS